MLESFSKVSRRYLSLLFFFLSWKLYAQTPVQSPRVIFGYHSQAGIQPGLKIGAEFSIKDWDSRTRSFNYFLNPNVAYYTWPGNDRNLYSHFEFGIGTRKERKKVRNAISLGAGYLLESQLISYSVNLGTGDLNDENREIRHYFVTTINYTWERKFSEVIDGYFKPSYGFRFGENDKTSALLFLELGVKYNLKPGKP